MTDKKYTVGVDFGTLSGRAVLVDVANGEELASSTLNYPHAVMDAFMPDGVTPLPPDWALQHPQDGAQIMAPAQDAAIESDHGVLPLRLAQPRALLDAVDGGLGRTAEHREDRCVRQE